MSDTPPQISQLANHLSERFASEHIDVRVEFSRPAANSADANLVVSANQIIRICKILRDDEGFEMLIDETAVDFWPQESPRFELVYQIRSVSHNQIISLHAPLDGNEPVAPSITGIYPNADWYEREIWDLFGIRFAGHPDLRRILMPHDWAGHPLRKDYPLGYEEPQFTFNYEKIQAKKLNPKE